MVNKLIHQRWIFKKVFSILAYLLHAISKLASILMHRCNVKTMIVIKMVFCNEKCLKVNCSDKIICAHKKAYWS